MEVKLENGYGKKGEYIIKDSIGISLGRIFLIEANLENHFYTFRVSYYKKSNHNILKEALNKLINQIFARGNVHKVNMLAEEGIDTRSFIDLGFKLEGVMSDTIWNNGRCKSEFLYGITSLEYSSSQIKNKVHLEGKNISLKVLLPSEAEKTLNFYIKNKEHLEPYEPERDESFYTIDVQRRILAENYKQYLNGESINFGIYNSNNELIGKIQLNNIVSGIFKNAFVGYSMDREYEGKGYMKEALKLVIEYSFNNIKLHRIEASTLVDNMRSQSVLKACGFEEVGINKSYLFINGMWRDHKSFYLINKNL